MSQLGGGPPSKPDDKGVLELPHFTSHEGKAIFTGLGPGPANVTITWLGREFPAQAELQPGTRVELEVACHAPPAEKKKQ